jgi:2-isopropylmalate synthase
MRPEDVGLPARPAVMGKHSGRAALRAKLKDLGFDMVDNQLNDLFVRFKALADRKKEVFDDDLIALVTDAAIEADQDDHLELKFLRVICGTEAPQSADITLRVGEDMQATAQGDGPVDAAFNAVKALFPNDAVLQLYQVQRGDRGHGRAGDRVRPDRGRRAHRHRAVGGYRHGGRQREGLCECAQPPDDRAEKLGSDQREVSYKDVS